MNINRFLGVVVGVWIIRVILNWTFYTKVVGRPFADISSAHPGMFRTVVPAYIVTDLIFALAFAFLFAKAGAVLGGGIKGGVILGLIVAVLSPVISELYEYYGVAYLPAAVAVAVAIFQVIAHAVEGAVAALIYGSRLWPSARLPCLGTWVAPG